MRIPQILIRVTMWFLYFYNNELWFAGDPARGAG
jgi:hypothetical protein